MKPLPINTLLRYYHLGNLGELITVAGHHFADNWWTKRDGECVKLAKLLHAFFDWAEQQTTEPTLRALIGYGSAFRPQETKPVEITKGCLWWKKTVIVQEPIELSDVDILAIIDDCELEALTAFLTVHEEPEKHKWVSDGYECWKIKLEGGLDLAVTTQERFNAALPDDHLCLDICRQGVLLAGEFVPELPWRLVQPKVAVWTR